MSNEETIGKNKATLKEMVLVAEATKEASSIAAKMMDLIENKAPNTATAMIAVASLWLYYKVNFPRLHAIINEHMDNSESHLVPPQDERSKAIREFLSGLPLATDLPKAGQ